MKVLLINEVCGYTSTGRICGEIASELSSKGCEVKIAYGRSSYVPDYCQNYKIRIGNNLTVLFHALQARLFDNQGFGSKGATKRFIKWADVFDPDIIWLHNLHGYYINIELLFRWIKMHPEKEVKWTLHDCWAFTGHCTHFLVSKCNKWKRQCEKCPGKKCYPKSLFLDNSKYNYNRKKELFCNVKNMLLITPSEWLKDQVRQSFLQEYPIEVRANEIDTRTFRFIENDIREKLLLKEKFIILGVASSWTDRKGFDDFLKLAGILDSRFKIILVGVTKKQIKNLPEIIIGIERTENREELAMYYSAADVFVNLTYEDNYPTVNLEAEACGTPVITYDTGGCGETIKRKDSKSVKTGNIEEVFQLIDKAYAQGKKF